MASALMGIGRGVQFDHSVEREFILIGEALSRLSKTETGTFSSITNAKLIIDFRNLLAHDYGAIDDDSVYGLAFSDLIVLKAEVAELLENRGEAKQSSPLLKSQVSINYYY
jgi:uncharacterized protein with HEPN domain